MFAYDGGDQVVESHLRVFQNFCYHIDFIAVISFGLTCFGLGYTFGKDIIKPQK
jgi:hypothetical protein